MHELIALPYSPWSERARWALDARAIDYRMRPYSPVVGEPALRLKLRRLRGNVTVPVLTTMDGRVLGDSTDIARWADGRGAGPTLFPADHALAMARLLDISERAMKAGRALVLSRMLRDREALAEMIPRPIRKRLGEAASTLGAWAIGRTLRKYGGNRAATEAHRRTFVEALDAMRNALATAPEGSPRTLLGRFSYADIAAAQVLASIAPPPALKLGKASRRCFSDDELAREYADLVAWRDALYAEFRGR